MKTKTKTRRANRTKRRTLKRKQRGGVKQIILLEDGSVVEGDIHKGKVRGVGTCTFTDGSVYEGPFNKFDPHGQGKLTMPDGHVYEGEFSHGGINGRGVMTDPKGNVTECEFHTVQDEHGMEFAVANGTGTRKLKNGNVYQGEFRNGMFNGHGKLTMTDGNVFEGDFRNDLVDGIGRLTHADGTVEEGLFRHINGELVHLDMPPLELDLELNPGPWNPNLKTRYKAERAIGERPSGPQ